MNSDLSGTAGFLKILQPAAKKDVWLGALFIMNTRGEPVEFTHARVKSPKPLLWHPDELRISCVASLVAAMFEICPVTPELMICLTSEVNRAVFTNRICLKVPTVRIQQEDSATGVRADWIGRPAPDSPAEKIYESLLVRMLLLEPFERADVGLREVYPEMLR